MAESKPSETVLGPVHPNAGVRVWYREALQELVRAMYADALRRLKAIYRDDPPEIGFAHDAADPVVRLKKSLEDMGKTWEKRLNRESATLAKKFADRVRRTTEIAMRTTLREAGFTVRFQPTDGMVSAYRAAIAEQVGLIKSIGQKFHTDVQSSVWAGVMRGADMSSIAKELQRNYGVSWRRAALIARDQSNKAKAVMEEARRGELGIVEAEWMHSHGGRTPRSEHVKWGRDRKRYNIRKGMWSAKEQKYVWPGTEINCFPGDALLQHTDGVLKAYRRWYSGQLTCVVTDSGEMVRATPNHPILTPQGWRPLYSLQEGDYVFSVSNESADINPTMSACAASSDRNVYGAVPCFAQVFTALSETGMLQSLATISGDFHGDVPTHSNVDVVLTAGPLRLSAQTTLQDNGKQLILSDPNDTTPAHSPSRKFSSSGFAAAPRRVSGKCQTSAASGALAFQADEMGGAPASQDPASCDDASADRTPSNTKTLGKREDGLSAIVKMAKLARIVHINHESFDDHVYNFETVGGWYVTGNIIAHNCRCVSRGIVPALEGVRAT